MKEPHDRYALDQSTQQKGAWMKHENRTRRKALVMLVLAGVVGLTAVDTSVASSHREAPLISEDPVADATDTYAFVAPDAPDKVTLIGNWIPFEEPAGGPNFYRFGDDVLYTFQIDNTGDAVADVSYELRFQTTVKNPNTFRYNTGPISAVTNGSGQATNYSNLNVQQSYTLTQVKSGVRTTLGSNFLVAPANIGPRSTPSYGALAGAAVYTTGGGIKVFAGPRDDPDFEDLGSISDMLGMRPLNGFHSTPLAPAPGKDELQGYNVHTIALQVPISTVIKPTDPVIGVWTATYRRQLRALRADGSTPIQTGLWVQVSRLGSPLINATFIPLGKKDRFNAAKPNGDGQFAASIVDPELGQLIPALYPVFSCFPTAPRNDLVTIFLTGIPGLNQPAGVVGSEQLRLNTSIAPTPFASQSRMGLLAGQSDGYPSGRRLIDDVTDITLQAVAGATPLGACNGQFPNNALTDGVDANDMPFLTTFPYVAPPNEGYQHTD